MYLNDLNAMTFKPNINQKNSISKVRDAEVD